jgi:transposase
MSKARLIITAVIIQGRSQHEVARAYGVNQSWVSRLVARYRAEGEAAFQPRSRRPKTSPTAIPPATVALITQLRGKLTTAGLDAGPDTIAWHLAHHHSIRVSAATISRYLTRLGLVAPQPTKRPKASYQRFQAELPNQCWQADFTHYPLAGPPTAPAGDAEAAGTISLLTLERICDEVLGWHPACSTARTTTKPLWRRTPDLTGRPARQIRTPPGSRPDHLRASKWRPTAVRTGVSAGRARPSGAKLGVLMRVAEGREAALPTRLAGDCTARRAPWVARVERPAGGSGTVTARWRSACWDRSRSKARAAWSSWLAGGCGLSLPCWRCRRGGS